MLKTTRVPAKARRRGHILTISTVSALLGACSGGRDTAADDGRSGLEAGTGSESGLAEADGGEATPNLDVEDGAASGAGEGGSDNCGGRGVSGDLQFSYIWIANHREGTISKLNTETLVEEGRYYTRAPGEGNPSRTSVSLQGDVAVANRHGGVTKVYAQHDDCIDKNANGVIDTSSGASDILPWGEDECIAWHNPMKRTDGAVVWATQRPIAWAQGALNADGCHGDARLWTATIEPQTSDTHVVHRLNGVDGSLIDEVEIEGYKGHSFGMYGGAVDGEGNFWTIPGDAWLGSPIMRVNAEDLSYEWWEVPIDGRNNAFEGYGITVDEKGRPWIAGFDAIARFDPVAEKWDSVDGNGFGLQSDGLGQMWVVQISGGTGMTPINAFDLETMAIVDTIAVPTSQGKGLSIDFHGNIWVVDETRSAFRVNPTSRDIQRYDGLTLPYTYSDMTGWGLANATHPPAG